MDHHGPHGHHESHRVRQVKDARETRQGRYSAWLKKAKSRHACFKLQSHVMRYFTIDFDAHIIFYSHSVLQKKVSPPIPFMDIRGAEELPLPMKHAKGTTAMNFGFVLHTKLRSFELYTSSSADAAEWAFALNVAMLMGKLKCLERLKVLQDGQEHLPTDVEKEEEEEALKQVEEAAARLQEDAKRKELRLLQIQLRAKDEVAAFRKEEEEAAEKKKQEQAAAEQKQVLEKQAEDLQMLQLQLLIQEEELTARKEEEEKAAQRKKEAAVQKKQEEEASAPRKQQAAKDLPAFEPSVLVEALAMLLASEVVESNGNTTAEWKEIQRLEEIQRARSKQPGTKHEATCLNPPMVVVPGASVNA